MATRRRRPTWYRVLSRPSDETGERLEVHVRALHSSRAKAAAMGWFRRNVSDYRSQYPPRRGGHPYTGMHAIPVHTTTARPDARWKPVVGWPWYAVSDGGRVKRIRTGRRRSDVGRELQAANSAGYPAVSLLDPSGKSRTYRVHRLVARAFLGPPPSDDHQVNHIDGDRSNNRVSNLEWVTQAENARHAVANGLIPRVTAAKLTPDDVLVIRRQYAAGGTTQQELADRYGVSTTAISAAVRGKTWADVGGPIEDRAKVAICGGDE